MATNPKIALRVLPVTSPSILTGDRVKKAAVTTAAAFEKDALTLWLRPFNKGTETKDNEASLERRITRSAADKTGFVCLALSDDNSAEEQVLGVSIWRSVDVDLPEKHFPETAASSAPAKPPTDPSLDEARLGDLIAVWTVANNLTNKVLSTGEHVVVDIDELKANGEPATVPEVPHFELTMMGVLPQYQGKGVGSALLNWGIKLSEERGVPLVLGASDEGRLLYLRRGFTELGLRIRYVTDEDEKRCGRLNDDLLVRWPKSDSSTR